MSQYTGTLQTTWATATARCSFLGLGLLRQWHPRSETSAVAERQKQEPADPTGKAKLNLKEGWLIFSSKPGFNQLLTMPLHPQAQ
ncbi:hypothetical protein [Microvirga tunisiensis]|uniref:hypothetical protein n=1 Tax=Microvirga tunisiensis TaxID=2108360 RepID=UPI00128E1DE1|nr:hypothetical protein [Microvirga tunisiensis]MPR12507.1 hypothetical protein [Microvirga tunisiensis]